MHGFYVPDGETVHIPVARFRSHTEHDVGMADPVMPSPLVQPQSVGGPPAFAFYHDGMREVQAGFDSTRLATRLEQLTVHASFSEADRTFIESASMVFVATADADGRPDCSYKGGHPGFIRILNDTTLAIPFYDGNGQYRTLGNSRSNPAVGLLFVDFAARNRLRINGDTELVTRDTDAAFVASFEGAEAVLKVMLRHAFPNCPRYVHDIGAGAISDYAPAPGHTPPEPDWKQRESFQPFLPKPR